MYNSRCSHEHALLAQLDRVFGYEPKGRGFESLTARQEKEPHICAVLFLCPLARVRSPVACFSVFALQNAVLLGRQGKTALSLPPCILAAALTAHSRQSSGFRIPHRTSVQSFFSWSCREGEKTRGPFSVFALQNAAFSKRQGKRPGRPSRTSPPATPSSCRRRAPRVLIPLPLSRQACFFASREGEKFRHAFRRISHFLFFNYSYFLCFSIDKSRIFAYNEFER